MTLTTLFTYAGIFARCSLMLHNKFHSNQGSDHTIWRDSLPFLNLIKVTIKVTHYSEKIKMIICPIPSDFLKIPLMKTTFHLVVTGILIFWISKESLGFIYLINFNIEYTPIPLHLWTFQSPCYKSIMLNNVNIQTHNVPCPWMEVFTRSRCHWLLEWGITVITWNLWRRRACIQIAR